MAWKVTIDGKSMLLDDLTEKEFVDACKDYQDETNWLRLYSSPGASPGAMYELIKIVALKLEVPTPPRPVKIKDSIAMLVDHFEQVGDDLPSEFGEGGLPLGEADETVTTTSSTSIEPEDGARTSSED